jgi:tetratricopeptide (TPR) repeat protein
MRGCRSLLVVALFASTASAAPKVSAKAKAAAKKHMEKAAAATTEGRHQDALTELDAAYKLDPQPMLLLARGHLYVKLEKCEDAIKLYEEYLATKPTQEMADSATSAIDTCKATLAPPPPPEPVKPTVVTSEELNIDDENPTLSKANRPDSVQRAPEPGAAPPKPVDTGPPTPRPWFKDPILLGLSVGGAAAITTSFVFYMSARSKIDDAETSTTYGEWIRNETEARDPRRYAIIFAAVGTILVGGAVFYGVRRQDSEPSRVTLVPTRDGGMVGYAGSF